MARGRSASARLLRGLDARIRDGGRCHAGVGAKARLRHRRQRGFRLRIRPRRRAIAPRRRRHPVPPHSRRRLPPPLRRQSFPQALQVANYIAAHSRPDARIAVVGSEPEIYFYSHRRAATGYIYTFPLMEAQPFASRMQREMIREIENAAPVYVVIVSVPTSWLRRADSDLTILDWSVRYCRDQMQLDAVVELLGGDPTAQHWNLNGTGIVPRTRYLLEVYKRKPPAG